MTFKTCVAELVQAAREISQDDPSLLEGDYEAFEAVMWPDDECACRHGLDAAAYRLAVSEAWRLVTRRRRAVRRLGLRTWWRPAVTGPEND